MSTSASADSLLLTTRLYRPRLRAALVPRPHLQARLEAGRLQPLTLVVAPASFGKTTLVAAWLQQATCPVAWLALDAGDNDPATCLRYMIAALQTAAPGVGADALLLLQTPQPPPPEPLLVMLLNDLATLPDPLILVLDDYHLITAPSVHALLAFLLERLPPQVHLVITSREEPPLPLARLRARGQMTDVRLDDLRFTLAEAAAFLREVMGLVVSDDEVRVIEARTEGWVAGLQLAALALGKRTDQAQLIQAFAGSNRYIVEYLMTEVLDRMPPHLRTFVVQTAILERMCGPLCDALLGLTVGGATAPADRVSQPSGVHAPISTLSSRHPAAANEVESYSRLVLEQLERANLFVIPLDETRYWYRYHHLFAEVLRERLYRGVKSDAIAALHQRASRWFAGQGLAREAIQHALAAEDWAQAAALLEQFVLLLGIRGEAATMLEWLARLPEAAMRKHPFLCLVHGGLFAITNRPQMTDYWLKVADQALQPDMPPDYIRLVRGHLALNQAWLARLQGDLARSVGLARQASSLSMDVDAFLHDVVLAYTGRTHQLTGNVDPDSEQQVQQALQRLRAPDYLINRVDCIINIARLQMLQGRLRAAHATLAEVVQVADTRILPNLVHGAYYYICLGALLYEWNLLDEADAQLQQVMQRVNGVVSIEAESILFCHTALARLQQARGDPAGALATLDAFVALARERDVAPLLVEQAMAVRARLQLAQGNLAAAWQWAATSGLTPTDEPDFPREPQHLTLARVLLAEGEAARDPVAIERALQLLARLRADAEAKARGDSIIKIAILQALAQQARGDMAAALAALEPALVRAAPEGYVRSFGDEGVPMANLLHAAQACGILPVYVAQLLTALPAPDPGRNPQSARTPAPPVASPGAAAALAEPLTAREREVLALLVAGHSNKVIAEQLMLSHHTVQTHVKAIFGKLGVSSRAAATRAALTHSLLGATPAAADEP